MQVEPVDFVGMTARRLADMHARCRCSGGADLWAQLREWVALAKKVSFPDGSEKAEKLKRLDPFPRFENELNALEDRLPSSKNSNGAALLEARSGVDRRALELLLEIRFCHLDLLSGNIMYSEEAGDVVFIDFEYANSCCIGFDIANHYNAVPESCLILENKFDAEMYFPSGVQQRHWFQAYLEARGIPADEELLGGLLRVVLEFSLFAELRWVIWSVVQAGHSPVDFDYLDYGVMRFEEGYMKYKAWCEAGGRP
uniref:ethanolamine kinase n=1 Tax=Zooxanthella nutricula TaxID=1333877 RepID=A0A7S2N8T2_9DINO